jgi:GxxExxY protein
MSRKEEKAELIYKDESYAIIGACFAVYGDKGRGFLEPVYHECLEIELELSISGSENFASFRVFGGLQDILVGDTAPRL